MLGFGLPVKLRKRHHLTLKNRFGVSELRHVDLVSGSVLEASGAMFIDQIGRHHRVVNLTFRLNSESRQHVEVKLSVVHYQARRLVNAHIHSLLDLGPGELLLSRVVPKRNIKRLVSGW